MTIVVAGDVHGAIDEFYDKALDLQRENHKTDSKATGILKKIPQKDPALKV